MRDDQNAEAAFGDGPHEIADDCAWRACRGPRWARPLELRCVLTLRPGPRRELALASGECADVDLERGELDEKFAEGLVGSFGHLLAIKHADLAEEPSAECFVTEEHVVDDGEIGRQGEVLVDALDAGLLSIPRSSKKTRVCRRR